jgi:hypothetical protein
MKITEIQIKRTSQYGHYRVTGIINGVEVSAITTDSEAFDYFNDDENQYKNAMAIAHCECLLIQTFENL